MLDAYDAAHGLNVVDWSEFRLIGHYDHSNVELAKRTALLEALQTGHRVGVCYAWSKRLIVVYTPDPPAPDEILW